MNHSKSGCLLEYSLDECNSDKNKKCEKTTMNLHLEMLMPLTFLQGVPISEDCCTGAHFLFYAGFQS
jgi:hypothetical protein